MIARHAVKLASAIALGSMISIGSAAETGQTSMQSMHEQHHGTQGQGAMGHGAGRGMMGGGTGMMGCPMMGGGMGGARGMRGMHGTPGMMALPPGNEKLQLQMQAEIMQKVGEIMAKYAAQIQTR